MTENYLDVTKSVMVSSPAGSGKTEKLARRYIELLKNGSEVERILAITFTDKAAAEMKERILNILMEEEPGMFEQVREKMPRMRISTIHSFCLKLLKRFCLELGIDPSLEVVDSFNADVMWSEAVYESLLEDYASGEDLFYQILKNKGIKGWNKLYAVLKELHGKRPDIEMAIRDMETGIEMDSSDSIKNLLSLYSKCLDRYRRKKLERHCLDYNDLEIMAYEAISKNAEWHNVLYSFDEHTDHILIDEFQDTSTLQWKIIDKLTEEWRSGMGAKREFGIKPTMFLVGDDKQSIYFFRGANVGIFRNAREKLSQWLGEEYHFIEIKENYRSLPEIIDFVNTLFEKLMPQGLYEDLKIEYKPFEATRAGEGNVELLLIDSIGYTKENRRAEASVIAEKIKELNGRYEIYEDDDRKRKCGYGDMAILLRGRTHLSLFEDALRRQGIPFIVVKGIGFYDSPEVVILKDILFFLIDSMDDYSLFQILRSPIFSIEYGSLFKIINESVIDGAGAGYLYQLLDSVCKTQTSGMQSLFPEQDRDSTDRQLCTAMNTINKWLEDVKLIPYSIMLEKILAETGLWQYFHEKQRYVNVKKFLRLVEEFEAKGLSGIEIREKLIKASAKSDESKANVNTEGMDAVKIMTIHAAKGLQFPLVFLPCLDEPGRARTGSVVIEENGSSIVVSHEEDTEIRKTMPVFQRYKEKIEEEEKRLFYVAATRAMDYLCMSGVLNDKPSGKLGYLFNAFNLTAPVTKTDVEYPFNVVEIKSEKIAEMLRKSDVFDKESTSYLSPSRFKEEMVFIEPIDREYKPRHIWLDVTEEVEEIREKHGEDWIILGRAFHRIFECISKGYIKMDNLQKKTEDILKNEVLSDKNLNRMKEIILSDLFKLKGSGYLNDIILPRDNSYSELPFILDTGRRIYRGRIDRVIIKDDTALIYDYKTYPVSEGEIKQLKERYFFQMDIYRKAAERLFSIKASCYIFFTHLPLLTFVSDNP
jgi:ATP-dependent helicase/nuclease subunit A